MINSVTATLFEVLNKSMWLAPILALLAGVLVSLTPCCLSSLPLIIGYVGGVGEKNTKRAFTLSLAFSVGNAITYTTLGVIASLLGKIMGRANSLWYIILGILMVLMALQTWELFQFIPSTYLISKSKRKGYLGAFIAGVLGGVFASPCSTPMLIGLLSIVAGKGSMLWGILLLLLYSIGHSALALVAGTSISLITKIMHNENYGAISNFIKIVMGTLILLLAFYMFYLGF